MWGGGCVFWGGEIVIMNEVKNLLAVSTTVDRHADLEIFRFAQDDMVAGCHSERSEESPRCEYTMCVDSCRLRGDASLRSA